MLHLKDFSRFPSYRLIKFCFISQLKVTVLITITRGGLMVSALVGESSGQGLIADRGHCVLFLVKTLNSHNAPLHPGI